jgi:hypothetical protein
MISVHPILIAAVASNGDQRVTIFFVQIALLIIVGRLLAEACSASASPP